MPHRVCWSATYNIRFSHWWHSEEPRKSLGRASEEYRPQAAVPKQPTHHSIRRGSGSDQEFVNKVLCNQTMMQMVCITRKINAEILELLHQLRGYGYGPWNSVWSELLRHEAEDDGSQMRLKKSAMKENMHWTPKVVAPFVKIWRGKYSLAI